MSLNKRDVISRNTIFKTVVGSRLYGLETESSDYDWRGIYIEPLEWLANPFMTPNEAEIVNLSVISKTENGKNTADAVDEEYWGLKKFMRQLYSNDPASVELLFASKCEINHPIMMILKANSLLFLDFDSIRNRFLNYAKSQLKKLETKSHNLNMVLDAFDKIKDIEKDGKSKVIDIMEKYHILGEYFKEGRNVDTLELGYGSFSTTILFKKFYNELEKIINNKTDRREKIEMFGYDPRFTHHTIRLLLEGIELLNTGKIIFPLVKRDELMKIKMGKSKLNEITAYAHDLMEEMDSIKREDTPFKHDVDYEASKRVFHENFITYYRSFDAKWR